MIKNKNIMLIAIASILVIGQAIYPYNVYAASDIGTLTNEGDSVHKTRSDGEN